MFLLLSILPNNNKILILLTSNQPLKPSKKLRVLVPDLVSYSQYRLPLF